MKRLLFAAMVLCMGVMAGSCDKDKENSGNDSIEAVTEDLLQEKIAEVRRILAEQFGAVQG